MTASEPRPTGDDVLKLVEEAAAVEREAAASIAQATGDRLRKSERHNEASWCDQIAARIRARSNPK